SNLFDLIKKAHQDKSASCIFIDEAQFLTQDQVWQLAKVADELHIPVMCYGLRTDFQAKLFPGSAALLAIADVLREVRTICWCGKKATMVARLDKHGEIVAEGEQIVIGGEESYISLCRHHWKNKNLG
ncbi:MAG: thymidine kinase, partial [Cohaesibacteraceae bacterium]|nr:thymidine kinase [Cohaesibacteraceae bacterium]